MLDIHLKWLLVLTANFLGLMFVLNIILFKPLLKIFKERDAATKGSLDAAREMQVRKDEGMAQLNKDIADARHKAKDIFETRRTEGLGRQKEMLSEAEAKASAMLQQARAELQAEVEKARRSLKADVEKFSDEIVRKMVKA